jgi:colanic acid/amylovoran biosynthesis glycosyltransferase
VSPRILAFVPTLGIVSETFISDGLSGLAAAGADIVVAAGHVADRSSVSKVPVIEAPILHLSRLSDRIVARLRPTPLWTGARDTLLDSNAARVVASLLEQVRPKVAYAEFGFMFARVSAPLESAGIPTVVHLHGHDVTAALADPGYRAALEVGLRKAAAVVVASDHIRHLAVLAGAPPERVVTIPCGVTLEGVSPLPWSIRRNQPPRVVFLGRLVPKKHPVALIEAFAIVAAKRPDATLDIIGDGPERAAAEERAEARGIANQVRFHGAMPRREALAIVREGWIYAQHSVTSFTGDQEGFGISIAEAAALELPVVSTLHNGIPEQVTEGKTGLLVPEYDFEAMAVKILSLLSDPDRCAMLGAAGRKQVLSTYRPQVRSEKLAAVLATAALHTKASQGQTLNQG